MLFYFSLLNSFVSLLFYLSFVEMLFICFCMLISFFFLLSLVFPLQKWIFSKSIKGNTSRICGIIIVFIKSTVISAQRNFFFKTLLNDKFNCSYFLGVFYSLERLNKGTRSPKDGCFPSSGVRRPNTNVIVISPINKVGNHGRGGFDDTRTDGWGGVKAGCGPSARREQA